MLFAGFCPCRCSFQGFSPCTRCFFQSFSPCTRRFLQSFPPCNPAPPFEKGGDPKTFSADKQHPFNERVKNPECRSRRFSGAAVNGRRSLPLPGHFSQGSRPAPGAPFEKGVDPKTFSADKQHPFNERVKNPECRSRRFSGAAVYGRRSLPLPGHFSQGSPPCNPAPPFEKGGDPKTFSVGGQYTFHGKA